MTRWEVRRVGNGKERVQWPTAVGWPAPSMKDWNAVAGKMRNAHEIMGYGDMGTGLRLTDVAQVQVSIIVERVHGL